MRLPLGAPTRLRARSIRLGALGFALAVLPTGSPAHAQAGLEAAEWDGNRVDYAIRARLDGDTKRLDGSETISWTNGTADAVDTLRFHLYLNAFANNRSTFFTESKGKARGHVVKEGWSWSRVTGAQLLDEDGGEGTDLLATLAFVSPDDEREEDRTVFQLDLPRPVAPGETVRLAIEWESQLPRVRRRTGYKDDFLLVAQWFPKLGVYEEGRGWSCHQFHSNTEFYSDYGTYDVTLDLPAEYQGEPDGEPRVGGGGSIVSSELKGEDRLLVRFISPKVEDQRRVDRFGERARVHDFTWTADPDFAVHRKPFRYAEWAREFKDEVELARRAFGEDEELELLGVDVRVLVQPEREGQWERHAHATEAALFFYGLWYGEYPYSEITVVDPAWGGRAAGGMEYPTLFTCGTRLFTTPDMHTPEGVTVHEAGHQFWYGLVGNNEPEAAWLDEGLNSFTDSEVLWRVYGPERQTTTYAGLPINGERTAPLPGGGGLGQLLLGREVGVPYTELTLRPFAGSAFLNWWRDLPGLHFASRGRDPRWGDRANYLRSPDRDPLDTFAWEHSPGAGDYENRSYWTNSYSRPAIVLRTLRGLVGEEAFLRGMRHYARSWRYRHPYPDDFFAAFQEGSETELDLGWYWDELFRGTGTGDWKVSVAEEHETEPRGYFLDAETGEYVKVGGAASEEDDESERPWTADILLERDGELRIPVDVRLTYENGDVEDLVWTREEQGEETWRRILRSGDSKLVSVVLDPAHKIWIDTDMSNNRWYDEADEVAPLRWGERAWSQTTRLLQWLSRLGG